MNNAQAVYSVLLTAREPLRARVIAARAGPTVKAAGVLRALSALLKRGHVSRVKLAEASCWRYYLTAAQCARASAPPVRSARVAAAPADIPSRLRFLEGLKRLPAFEGMPIIDLMLADYRQAHVLGSETEDV